MKPNISQVARTLGMSRATVTRALSGTGGVSSEKKKKILAQKDKDDPGKKHENLTAIDYLKEREHPILAVYPLKLEPVDEDTKEEFESYFKAEIPVFGFAIGFPKKEEKVMVKYRINKVKIDELNNGLEFGDEEEEEPDDN